MASSALLSLILAAQGSATLAERISAVQRLGAESGYAAAPYLAAVALRSDEPAVLRAAAAEELAACGRPVCASYLAPLLDDPAIQVRSAALQGLTRLGKAEPERLQRAAMTDPSREVRLEAARALAALGTPLAGSALEVVTTDVDPAVRAVVSDALKAVPERDPRAQALADELLAPQR